ncbi:MAG TPA: amidohydrolase family protein, partial [Spirochaetia bacterium]|nr:amidohydrolase family protein [Spirochaetia bacterium]
LSEREIVVLLREVYRSVPKGELIVGNGWDYPHCLNPHRLLLDEAFPDNPVSLFQFSGHGVWVNSRLLDRLRISRLTPDPVGGRIVRDERGEPSGVLYDAAARPLHIMRNVQRNKHPENLDRFLETALSHLRENGVTSVQDNTWYPDLVRLYGRFESEGRLTVRVSCWSDGRAPARKRRLEHLKYPGEMITLGPAKYFLDGTFSTKTAWLLEPYSGDPQNYGIPMGSIEWMRGIVLRAAKAGRQSAFHAIGDRAVRELVSSVEAAALRYPRTRELRMRIEHGQLIYRDDIPRIRDLGIVVSAQPHALGTPEKDRDFLGEARSERAYPYRSLLDAGVKLSFGSDIPGESTFRPLLAIHNIVNRRSPERITVAEAIQTYTAGSAFAELREGEKGTITPGKLADLVVLSDNPLESPKERIKDIRIDRTIVGGRIVYERGAQDPPNLDERGDRK